MEKKLKLEVLASDGCSSGPCPKLYKSEDGRYFIQGYNVDENVTIDIPKNENLVEVNKDLLNDIVQQIGKQ